MCGWLGWELSDREIWAGHQEDFLARYLSSPTEEPAAPSALGGRDRARYLLLGLEHTVRPPLVSHRTEKVKSAVKCVTR